jgi:hypothetical protein
VALTVAGWLAVVCGAVVTLLGVMLFSAIFMNAGVPVGGAGLFAVLTVGAGPVLTLIGITVMVSGFKLTGGQEWPRTVIQVFSWVVVCASLGWSGYSAAAERHIHLIDVVHWGILLLWTAVPGIALILLLRK